MYNPKKHHRKSIRLPGYDYSNSGAYFITLCTQNRQFLFGEIMHGNMVLNDAGIMIEKWYHEIENKFPGIQCTDYITMPNHFHCIIKIPLGKALRGPPNPPDAPDVPHLTKSDSRNGLVADIELNAIVKRDAHIGASLPEPDRGYVTIFEIMDWFKTMTTNEYIRGVKTGKWPRFQKRVWQLRYWDHIVRNGSELSAIRQYITNNPSKWESDRLNEGAGNHVLEESVPYEWQVWMV